MKVLIFGTFDRLHPGHRYVLEEARKRGRVTVVVARNENVRKLKGRAPEQNENERKRAIEEACPEASVMLGDPEDFATPLRTVRPDLVLLGYDQRLPPGVSEEDFPCPVERIAPFEPEKYKSSLRREG